VVVDALSRKYEEEGSLFSLSFIVADWLQVIHQEWLQDPKLSLSDPTIATRSSSLSGILLAQ
jgi:hypothetical protein